MIRTLARHYERRHEQGETLIEILLTVAILGIGSMGLIAALSTGIVGTEGHRRLSDTEKVARAYGELVKNKLVHPPSTTLTQDVDFGAGDHVVLHVVDTSGFLTWDPTSDADHVALDGAVLTLDHLNGSDSGCTAATCMTTTAETGGTSSGPWTDGTGQHVGSTVAAYKPCPTPGFFATSAITSDPTQLGELSAPAVGNGVVPSVSLVTFYDARNNVISDSSSGSGINTCTNYHTTTAVPCDASNNWRTSCDPVYVRMTVTVTSTDVGKSTGAKTVNTDVVVRRVS